MAAISHSVNATMNRYTFMVCFGVKLSHITKIWRNTMTTATTRALVARKPAAVKKSKSTPDDEYLASLSPWARKLELLARPLRGKLTKAIEQK